MIAAAQIDAISPKRSALASYANAYAVAVQLRRATGRPQYVLRTGNPLQPFQVTSTGPTHRQALLTLIA
ncbi:hypothetical protein [Sphingobium sp. TCM1]|uniref:hypothetical protein n=1 Tax=Sphingobium sp. TCM1 TaxID=453246 RepID=UPI0007F4E9DA|nr:hypothetical protein [Sphingobium sp. TCM1]OAN53504.1 hypothetical protein A7Q26_05660 [Sphingobium sp. TCM1]